MMTGHFQLELNKTIVLFHEFHMYQSVPIFLNLQMASTYVLRHDERIVNCSAIQWKISLSLGIVVTPNKLTLHQLMGQRAHIFDFAVLGCAKDLKSSRHVEHIMLTVLRV